MDLRVNEFATAEAKARFSELLERAENGEQIIIKRHGKAVAKLVPATPGLSVAEREQASREWLAIRDAPGGPRLAPGETTKQLIEEGRKY